MCTCCPFFPETSLQTQAPPFDNNLMRYALLSLSFSGGTLRAKTECAVKARRRRVQHGTNAFLCIGRNESTATVGRRRPNENKRHNLRGNNENTDTNNNSQHPSNTRDDSSNSVSNFHPSQPRLAQPTLHGANTFLASCEWSTDAIPSTPIPSKT